MTSKILLCQLFNEANRLSYEEHRYTTHDLWEMYRQIETDLKAFEILKDKLELVETYDIDYIHKYYHINQVKSLNKEDVETLKEILKGGEHN